MHATASQKLVPRTATSQTRRPTFPTHERPGSGQLLKYPNSAHRPLTSTSRQRDERVQLHKDARRFSNVCSRTEVVGEPTMCVVRCSRAKLVISHARAEPNWSAARKRPMWNHPRQSPTIHPCCPYFPVFSSPTATFEVVGNTGNMSSEKAGVGGSTPSLATIIPKDLGAFVHFLQPKVDH